MSVRTVKVANVSLGATEQDIKEFFSFSGDIEYVELRSVDEWSQVAYVTFKHSQGVENALLLSGATIVDLSVIISVAHDYQLPPAAGTPVGASAPPMPNEAKSSQNPESAFRKAEDVVSGVLAKGLILGKDVISKAKSFDEKHQLTSTASAKVSSLDKKIGLTEKVSMGASIMNEKVKGVDEKFHVSEKAKSAFATAEQKVGSAGSAVMNNRYIFSGVAFVAGAFNKVAKAAGEVTSKTKEKVLSQEDLKGSSQNQPQSLPSPPAAPVKSTDIPAGPPPAYESLHGSI